MAAAAVNRTREFGAVRTGLVIMRTLKLGIAAKVEFQNDVDKRKMQAKLSKACIDAEITFRKKDDILALAFVSSEVFPNSVMCSLTLQSGVSYLSQGFEDNALEVSPADWLILYLPTAQADPHNSHGKT